MVSRQQLIEAMSASTSFPGYYPIVVIARSGGDFAGTLAAAVAYAQDGDPFSINERQSSNATYTSYHIQVYVHDPETALERKEMLRAIDGVLMTL